VLPTDSKRWKSEQEFFDSEEYRSGPIPDSTIHRYTVCRKPFLPAEFPFWVLGDVSGKRVLELGCGDGGTSILLALKGAVVTGVDISPRAVEVATQRAQLHGVSERVTFLAQPLESYVDEACERFDVVLGFAVLHHVCPTFDDVMAGLAKLAHNGTVFVFCEPVSLSSHLRRIRLALPLKVRGTSDERPLEPLELEIIRRYLPNTRIRMFNLLLRLWARFLPGRYEDFPMAKRAAYDLLGRLDSAILLMPGFSRLGGSAVIYSTSGRKA